MTEVTVADCENRRYFRSMKARNSIVLVLALSLSGGLACRDHVTGPEAVKAIDRVEASFGSHGTLRFDWLLHRMGWAPAGLTTVQDFARDQFTVRSRNGRTRYRAYVVERVLKPNVALGPDDACVSAGLVRRGAIFFRDDQRDAIELYGSDFEQPLAPHIAWCPNDTLRVLDPRPVLWYVPNPTAPSPAWWWATGRASISPGVEIGPCPFLRPAAEQFLREKRGVSCVVTRHQVSFDAIARQPDAGTFPVRLALTDVFGIRYTIHCDGEADRPGNVCPSLDNHVM